MPELPEVEAWRRQLDADVKRYPIERAGPAHIATLKTFDPPLAALEGEGLAGARRRAKRFLFPTDDGELVVQVHLMSAGRLRYLKASEKGPKSPVFRLRFTDGGELVLTEAGRKRRACCAPMHSRPSLRTSGLKRTSSPRKRSHRFSRRTRAGCTRCFATSG